MKVWIAKVCDGNNDLYGFYFNEKIPEQKIVDYMLHLVYIKQQFPDIIGDEDYQEWIEQCKKGEMPIKIVRGKDIINIYFFNMIPDIEIYKVELITIKDMKHEKHNLTLNTVKAKHDIRSEERCLLD